MTITSTPKSSDTPSQEYRFFIYDPAGWGFKYYRSAADRDACSDAIIQAYLDDGWDEEVENVVAGEVTHTCQKVNVEHRHGVNGKPYLLIDGLPRLGAELDPDQAIKFGRQLIQAGIVAQQGEHGTRHYPAED